MDCVSKECVVCECVERAVENFHSLFFKLGLVYVDVLVLESFFQKKDCFWLALYMIVLSFFKLCLINFYNI